jgi:hypothetical protein
VLGHSISLIWQEIDDITKGPLSWRITWSSVDNFGDYITKYGAITGRNALVRIDAQRNTLLDAPLMIKRLLARTEQICLNRLRVCPNLTQIEIAFNFGRTSASRSLRGPNRGYIETVIAVSVS